MRQGITAVFLLAIGIVLAGCETVKGVGRDITNASSTVQNGLSSNKGAK